MAELCRFAGIVISIFSRDHNPPHFHASYAGDWVEINIRTLKVTESAIPTSQLNVLLDWARMHQAELEIAWNTVRAGGRPKKIEP